MTFSQTNSVAGVAPGSAGTVATALARAAGGQTTRKAAATETSGSTSASNSSSDSADGSATITANDFLTLLVSELQNQDPTQPTDPNQYISQLVGVNSLQQLISINQGLTSIEPLSSASGSSSTGTSPTSAAPSTSGS